MTGHVALAEIIRLNPGVSSENGGGDVEGEIKKVPGSFLVGAMDAEPG